MSAFTGNIFKEIEEKFEADRPHQGGMHDSPQWMRRCFMTGKQCIFCPQETVFEKGENERERDSVFVVMPFKPNLETFYEWSLSPYLRHFNIHGDNIRRADQFANTGYVMCEKICLRIQQAGFVVVDLSLYNPNVYYELGIAVGLNKPLLAVCDGKKKLKVEKLCKAVGIDSDAILFYPNLGYIDVEETPLIDRIQKVRLEARKVTMKTVGLLLRDEVEKTEDPSLLRSDDKDINVIFPKALEAAVGVAMRLLEEKHRGKPEAEETARSKMPDSAVQLAAMLKKMGEEELKELRGCAQHFVMDDKGSPHSFEVTAAHLNSALITIVDLVSQDALSYFWLGYCHARNINVIPIYRSEPEAGPLPLKNVRVESARTTRTYGTDSQDGEPNLRRRDEHILAFDIRALWYMNHDQEKSKELAGKLAAVFEPILLRDVATQQRRIFWERLTRSGKVLIYNGAIHYGDLNREVVGDWDLRTASELITYLSSTDESVMPSLQSPLYSPETVATKSENTADDADFLKAYEDLVQEQLKGKNCIVVASADVNPITEIILANIQKKKIKPFTAGNPSKETSLVVAFKGASQENMGSGAPASQRKPFERHFCKIEGPPDQRGFYIDGNPQQQKYFPQDKADKQEILAHLIVAKNPFSEGNVVVILNGVSGPATFGLAELLTGGLNGSKASSSEALLKEINELWAARVEIDSKLKGVEAIVGVSVLPPDAKQPAGSKTPSEELKAKINGKLFDRRTVGEWRFLSEEKNDFEITGGNPRVFPN